MEYIWITNMVIIAIEFIIFFIISFSYIKNYKKTGLKVYNQIFVFLFVFMVQSAMTLYIYYNFSKFLGLNVSLPLLIINITGLTGTVLLYRFISQ